MNKSKYLGLGIVLIILASVGIYIWRTREAPYYPVIDSPRPYLGSNEAKVVIEEFSDFQCPACKAAQPLLKDIINTFGERIKLSYRHYPLVSIHTNAFRAALAVECANDQGKFWLYHDKLFSEQPALSRSDLLSYAAGLGLDSSQFTACLDSKAKTKIVRQDINEGDKRGVNSTPSFFLNGAKVADWTKLKELIQAKLIGG
ncbi:MAG: DsbA family protein [Candidatus Kerfeldbacteria bacterium]|nr:DsbA family protein [Candidatus Kerfeldbacteria bacterium]